MDECNTCFNESLCLLSVLAMTDGMTFCCKPEYLVNQALSDLVQIDEQASSISIHIECLVEVSSMVHFQDQVHNNI